MTVTEVTRSEVFSDLQKKLFTQVKAAEILGISPRQVRRLFRTYKTKGSIALISKKRGKPGNHQLPHGLKDLALAIIQEKYRDFGPTFAHEKLVEIHHMKLSVWTVRKIMISSGLWIEKKIKKKRIYQLRERRSREGELIQVDGSPHAWFEGRGPKCSLIYCIDDATGKIMAALFVPSEALWPYFSLMRLYLKKWGRPLAFYCDKHGVFKVNQSEALSGRGVTQFGRAMQELEIQMIFANSPQAKGRIERSNQTLQDRLVKELRLQQISTLEEADLFLPSFIEDYNSRFAVIPKDPNNAHRPLLPSQNLNQIFTIQEFRYLSKNLTFQYKNTVYQIWTNRESYTLRKARISIREKEDGSIEVFYNRKPLAFTSYKYQLKQGDIVDSKQLNEAVDNLQKRQGLVRRYKPSIHHPWKRKGLSTLYE